MPDRKSKILPLEVGGDQTQSQNPDSKNAWTLCKNINKTECDNMLIFNFTYRDNMSNVVAHQLKAFWQIHYTLILNLMPSTGPKTAAWKDSVDHKHEWGEITTLFANYLNAFSLCCTSSHLFFFRIRLVKSNNVRWTSEVLLNECWCCSVDVQESICNTFTFSNFIRW